MKINLKSKNLNPNGGGGGINEHSLNIQNFKQNIQQSILLFYRLSFKHTFDSRKKIIILHTFDTLQPITAYTLIDKVKISKNSFTRTTNNI